MPYCDNVINKLLRVGRGNNYIEFGYDGEITLSGAARVCRHIVMDPERFRLPGVTPPGEGFEGLFHTLDFASNREESAYVEEHVPWRWDVTTDVEIMIDWLHDSADNGKVRWGLEYKTIGISETIDGAGTIIEQTSAGNHPAGKEVRTIFTARIPCQVLAHDNNLAIRLFRNHDHGDDTLAEDARMIHLHLHFAMDRLGCHYGTCC